MKKRSYHRIFRSLLAIGLAVVMTMGPVSLPVSANDSWPFLDAPIGPNEPDQHGYHANDIFRWCPEADPHARYLRSRIPRQQRINVMSEFQAHPHLPQQVSVFNLAGDYGNAFFDNSPYTDKFARNHFMFWQYTDIFGHWHGVTTANAGRYMRRNWDDQAMADWESLWFEFGVVRMPDPTWADAARRNGNLILADWFTSHQDRGQQTYGNFLVQRLGDNGELYFPAARQLIAMADFFGFDGFFLNQEEGAGIGGGRTLPNVALADMPLYLDFLHYMLSAGLYILHYDALNVDTGAMFFDRQLRPGNRRQLWDNNRQISHSLFIDYVATPNRAAINTGFAALLYENPAAAAMGLTLYDVFRRGLEVGSGSVDGAHWAGVMTNRMRATSDYIGDGRYVPWASFALLGADKVHSDMDRNMAYLLPADPYGNADFGQVLAGNLKHRTDYQWMTTVREQLLWSGPRRDPRDNRPGEPNATRDVFAVDLSNAASRAAGVNNFGGFSQFFPENSVIGGTNFFTNFNVGRGMRMYNRGNYVIDRQWSNMSMQDIPPTWQWWVDAADDLQNNPGSRLFVDFDYGRGVKVDPNPTRQAFTQWNAVGGYMGGNSLVINGRLAADNFIRLFMTDLQVNADTQIEVTYLKSNRDDDSLLNVGIIFRDNPANVYRIPIPDSNLRSHRGWQKATIDLSEFAGRSVGVLGFVVEAGEEVIEDYRINIGQLRFFDGSVPTPATPTGLSITRAYRNTNEMFLEWNFVPDEQIPAFYQEVVMYKVYVNDIWVGGRFDEVFFIKDVPARSGTIGLVAVSADGTESAKTTIPFDMDSFPDFVCDREARFNQPARSYNANPTDRPNLIQPSGITMHSGWNSSRIAVHYDVYQISETAVSIRLPEPDIPDWRFMYVFETDTNGVMTSRAFTLARWGNTLYWPHIARGRSSRHAHMPFTINPNNVATVSVVIENFSGDRSTPVYVWGGEPKLSAVHFPDSYLLDYIRDLVGDDQGRIMESAVMSFNGTLDIPSEVTDFRGLNRFFNAGELIINNSQAGNDAFQALFANTGAGAGNLVRYLNFPTGIRSLTITNSPGFTSIHAASVARTPAAGGIAANAHNALPRPLRRSANQSNSYDGGRNGSSVLLERVDFSGSGLVEIPANLFAYTNVREINISNMANLEVLNLNNSCLERIIVGDHTALANLTSVNLSGSRFDLSGTTQEGQFVEALLARGVPVDMTNQRTRVDTSGLAQLRHIYLTYLESFDFDTAGGLELMGNALVSQTPYAYLANRSWFNGVSVRIRGIWDPTSAADRIPGHAPGWAPNPINLNGARRELAGRPGYFAIEYMRPGQTTVLTGGRYWIERYHVVHITSPTVELEKFLDTACWELFPEEYYTVESWAAYRYALNAMKALLAYNPLPERDIYAAALEALLSAYAALAFVVVDVIPTALVNQIPGNQNELVVTITEILSDGTENVITESFMVDNNSDVTVTVGGHQVFISVRGNTQIREIRIV